MFFLVGRIGIPIFNSKTGLRLDRNITIMTTTDTNTNNVVTERNDDPRPGRPLYYYLPLLIPIILLVWAVINYNNTDEKVSAKQNAEQKAQKLLQNPLYIALIIVRVRDAADNIEPHLREHTGDDYEKMWEILMNPFLLNKIEYMSALLRIMYNTTDPQLRAQLEKILKDFLGVNELPSEINLKWQDIVSGSGDPIATYLSSELERQTGVKIHRRDFGEYDADHVIEILKRVIAQSVKDGKTIPGRQTAENAVKAAERHGHRSGTRSAKEFSQRGYEYSKRLYDIFRTYYEDMYVPTPPTAK